MSVSTTSFQSDKNLFDEKSFVEKHPEVTFRAPDASPQDGPKPGGLPYRVVKRVFDVAFSAAAIAVLAVPMAVACVAIRLESPGSPVFATRRIGRDGKPFRIYKLRTMYVDAHTHPERYLNEEQLAIWAREQKVDDDPRITHVGRILRATSLDELPQFLNVLKGDLSVIGPRPVTEEETWWLANARDEFLSCKPGITGWWQVTARNDATWADGERQMLELFYVRHACLGLDVCIFCSNSWSHGGKDGQMSLKKQYSVLMSVYAKDNPAWLMTALESMAVQTLPPTEIVLVQDGPIGEGLLGAIASFEKAHPNLLVSVPLEKNGGLGPALSAGLPFCSTDIVVRMDSDDYSFPSRCERQIDVLLSGYDMVGCNVSEFESDPLSPRSVRILPEHESEIIRFSKRRSPFAHPAFVAFKAAFESVGAYRNIRFAEDYDLFIRMLAAGLRGCNLQETLVAMRVDDNAYRRRGGVSYFRDMMSFNLRQLKEGWFSPADFVVRSAANASVGLLPNGMRNYVYRRLLRREL